MGIIAQGDCSGMIQKRPNLHFLSRVHEGKKPRRQVNHY